MSSTMWGIMLELEDWSPKSAELHGALIDRRRTFRLKNRPASIDGCAEPLSQARLTRWFALLHVSTYALCSPSADI